MPGPDRGANQYQEVVPEDDQGTHRAREALSDRHGRKAGLRRVAFGLKKGLVPYHAMGGRLGDRGRGRIGCSFGHGVPE